MGIEESMAALLDKVGGKKEIVSNVKRLVGDEGLGGLVGKFTAAGYDEKVKSWIGMGSNKPLTSEEVVKTLGTEKVAKAAEEAGISHEEAATQLAEAIPKVVDTLTPEGRLPERELVGKP